jgi:hypothetical protein
LIQSGLTAPGQVIKGSAAGGFKVRKIMGFVAEKPFCYSHSFGIVQILPNKCMSRYNRGAIMA